MYRKIASTRPKFSEYAQTPKCSNISRKSAKTKEGTGRTKNVEKADGKVRKGRRNKPEMPNRPTKKNEKAE